MKNFQNAALTELTYNESKETSGGDVIVFFFVGVALAYFEQRVLPRLRQQHQQQQCPEEVAPVEEVCC
ncbi:MAG: hypothetical protein HOP08_18450 [Cyclobacteriaceae bacterium]|nr:hypothetical protein [Cyclobacteriaceae bacterium]